MNLQDAESIFRQWLAKHRSAVIKIARAYTASAEECEDLAQEILLQSWRSIDRFRGDSSIATWFYRIGLNTAMNWKRKSSKIDGLLHQPIIDGDLATDPDQISTVVENKEMVGQLYDAIRRLRKSDAAIILLHLDQMPSEQIAEVLGITVNNVGVRLHRVRSKLREIMTEAKS